MAKILLDVNSIAIRLVEDHPGHQYITRAIDQEIARSELEAPEYSPYRALWILTTLWGIEREQAFAAIRTFVNEVPVGYACASLQTIKESFRLSEELGHDVYDCYYLALGKQEKAEAIMTTDQDFEKLAPKTGMKYYNPVPKQVLRTFTKWST